MKIKIDGRIGKKEMLQAFAQVLNSLEAIGVNDFKGVNLYFNPYVSGVKVVPQLDGKEFDIIHKSKEIHILKDIDENKKTTIDFVKDQHIKLDFEERLSFEDRITLPTAKELHEIEAVKRELYMEKQRLAALEHQKKLNEMRKVEQQEKDIAAKCLENLRLLLNMSDDEFKIKRSSYNWITTKKGIEKYTSVDIGEKAFRVSMKTNDKDKKNVYLFNEKCEIVFESDPSSSTHS